MCFLPLEKLRIHTIHNGCARTRFRKTVSLSYGDAQTEFHLIVSVWTKRSASAKNKPNATPEYLFCSSKNVLVKDRCFIAPFSPLKLIFVSEIEDGLAERSRFLHFFVYSFGDAIENKLKQLFYIYRDVHRVSSTLLFRTYNIYIEIR